MANPGIHAERNLIVNGDFAKPLTTGWTRGAINPAYTVKKELQYGGFRIFCLSAQDRSSAFQLIEVPKTASADAYYVLTCLCEMYHKQEGVLKLSVEGVPGEQEIPLRVGPARDRKADQVREANGLSSEFNPVSYEVKVTLPLQQAQQLRVAIASPPNEPGDYLSSLRITNINLQLHLPATKLQAVKLDEQTLPLDQSLPLCLGADSSYAHRLIGVYADDDQWLGTRASLEIENNPQGAIVANPPWGGDKPLEDPWALSCPDIEGEPPHRFTLRLLNEFNAPPKLIPVSLDHHRLKFLELKAAAHYVVLEYKDQSARVGVRVGSYYTDKALEGRAVTWTVEGTSIKTTSLTDDQGWAWFDHRPLQAGDLRIHVSVESRYYTSGVVTETFEVKALATDPLKDVLTLVAAELRPWEQKGYPNRGTSYSLKVRFPAVLKGTLVSLDWSGEHADYLGITTKPEPSSPVLIGNDDLEWILQCQDRIDGQFSLALKCSHLQKASSLKPMSLARNVVKPGDVREPDRVCVVDENESARMWVQVLHETASGVGDPVERALVLWDDPDGTVTRSFTGAGGWSSHTYQPRAAGSHTVIARIMAHEEAEPTEKSFAVQAIATSSWKQHVEILLDGETVDRQALGLICRRGKTHSLKIVPVRGSAWIGTKTIRLNWREVDPKIGLEPSGLDQPFPLVAEGVTWSLSSSEDTSISRLFELKLEAQGVADARELSGRLIHQDLTKELSVRFDQVSAALDGGRLYPCLGAEHRFSIWAQALSPLAGLMATLTWSGTPAEQLGATVLPLLDEPQMLGADGALWELVFINSEVKGEFALTLSVPQLDFIAHPVPMSLAHNAVRFDGVLESPVDPVVNQDSAWTWARVVSRFTGQRVPGVSVTWRAEGDPVVVETDAEGNSGYGFVPTNDDIHHVQLSLLSLYDNYPEEKNATVQPSAVDPWTQVTMSIDGEKQEPWGQKTGFPRRKGRHSIVAFLPDSLEGQVVCLGQTGTAPSALGNRYDPPLGAPQVVSRGLVRFELSAGDSIDAGFALQLSAERLARLSPANAMSQGPGSQVMKLSTVSRAGSQLLWREAFVAVVEVISSTSGKPMRGVVVTFSHPDLGDVNTVTDFYGRATVSFVPATPGASQVIAKVGDAVNSDSVAMGFTLAEPRKIVELYEPTGSREPPDVSRAHAKAKVTSALTGLPLARVSVVWAFAGQTIEPSLTDELGIASLTFTYSDDGDGLLTAMVEGGRVGWDEAVLAYTGDVPLIQSLTTPATTIAVGEQVRADIKVIGSQSGQPMGGVRISWVFGGESLPFTHSNADGTSFILFTPTEPGEKVLTATVGFGNEKSLAYTVVFLELAELKVSVPEAEAGSNFTLQARVSPAISGVSVLMRSTGEMNLHSRTDPEGWSLPLVFKAKRPVDDHFATVSATINAGQEGEKTLAKRVWVRDPAARGISLWVNNSLVALPDFVVELRPSKEQFIRFIGDANEGTADKEFAIFLDNDISSDPVQGHYQPMNGNGWFNWAIRLSAPVGTHLALVVASRDAIFVQRMLIEVIA